MDNVTLLLYGVAVAIVAGAIGLFVLQYKNPRLFHLFSKHTGVLRRGNPKFVAGHMDSEPACNVDGTPMVHGVDINGNPYGVT